MRMCQKLYLLILTAQRREEKARKHSKRKGKKPIKKHHLGLNFLTSLKSDSFDLVNQYKSKNAATKESDES